MVGNVGVGGDNPIRVQSMTTTLTKDVEATLAQTMRLVEAGCEIVRITTPTSSDARALGEVKRRLLAQGIDVPLVADIHFSPNAAMEAAALRRQGAHQPRQLRRRQAVQGPRVHRRRSTQTELARIEEKFAPVVAALQGARHRHAHRHQPRLALRPHHEPLRRHAAGHGRESRWSSSASARSTTTTTSSSR